MSWSSQRRLAYLAGFLLVAAVLIGVPAFFVFYEKPTCTDGVQNGSEDGVDCGGGCPVVCSFSAADAVVRWDRFFQIIPGVYAALALVENPNGSVGAVDVPYSFKLRDADNVLVYERKGRMQLPPKSVVPVFETGIQTGSRVPVRSEFAFGEPVWGRATPSPDRFRVAGERLDDVVREPTLTATLRNVSNDAIGELAVVAVLYDAEDNAVQSARTIIDGIAPRGEAPLVFTWPQPIETPVARIDIIPVPGFER